MSCRQKSLDGFLGESPTTQVATPLSKEEELKKAIEEASSSPTKTIKLEDELRISSEEDGRIFVPNGSRDRYGQPRRNVGGRPKKNAGLAEELLEGEKILAIFMEGWLSARDEDPQAFEELHDFTREDVYTKMMFITGKSQWSTKKDGKVTKFILKR